MLRERLQRIYNPYKYIDLPCLLIKSFRQVYITIKHFKSVKRFILHFFLNMCRLYILSIWSLENFATSKMLSAGALKPIQLWKPKDNCDGILYTIIIALNNKKTRFSLLLIHRSYSLIFITLLLHTFVLKALGTYIKQHF